MSRRSRRRKGGKSGESGGSKWLMALVVLMLVMVVTFAVINTVIRRYLRSDEFRIFLSDKVSESIHVEGEFKPLQWDGLAVRSNGFEAEGEEQIRMVNIEGLRTEVGLGGFWRGVWEIRGFQVREVDVELDVRSGVPPIRREDKPEKKRRLLPSEVELKNVKIDRVSVKALTDSGPLTMQDVQVEAEPGSARKSYEVKMTGGTMTLPDKRLPKLRLDEIDLRYKESAVFITHAQAGFWDRGHLELSGEWDPKINTRGVQGTVSGVTCTDLVNDDWKKRLRGDLSSDFEVAWVADEPVANGHLVLRNGVITALPILEVMEAYLDTSRFRVLTLSEAHTDWRWRDGQWSVTNLVLHSDGLMRLEGDMHVIGETIDGNFRLGVAPGTLARIPGAEEHVFLPGKDGLRWAPVRVTGTLSDPQHDLTERLIDAAGRRLLENLPETTVKSLLLGKEVIDVSTQKAVQEGLKLLGGGGGEVDRVIQQGVEGAVEGLLQGLFK